VVGVDLEKAKETKENRAQNRERDEMCRGSRAIGTGGKYVEKVVSRVLKGSCTLIWRGDDIETEDLEGYWRWRTIA